MREASVPIGACSTPPAIRNSPSPGDVEAPNFLFKVMTALAIGLLLSIPIFAIPRVTAAQAAVIALTANAIGAWSANVVDYWVTHYFVLGSQIAMFVGAGLLIPLIMIMKQRIEELAAIMFGAKPARLLSAQASALPERAPLVSIHIPACREPPEMLRQTLDSVAKLDWPNFECVVVINNTPDPAMWGPIEHHCQAARGRASNSCAPTGSRASRQARSGSRSSTPRPRPRSSALSMPTMWCIRTG